MWLCHNKGRLWITRGNPLHFFFVTEVNSLMNILVDYRKQLRCGCVSLRVGYSPKWGILVILHDSVIALMIIWIQYRKK